MDEHSHIASWRTWFQTPESDAAKKILDEAYHDNTTILPRDTAVELRSIMKVNDDMTDEELGDYLSSMTIKDLQNCVSGHVSGLKSNAVNWQAKRSKGWRRVRTGMQDFVSAFDAFLSGFSGVVDIVKLADDQYGGAATTLLSILFATVKLKAASDSSILSSMWTISNRLPDLTIYNRVYADAQLATMLAKAYADVVVFARSASEYFRSHGYVRVFTSVFHSTKFQDRNDAICQNFTEVRTRCEALLADRINDLSIQNGELAAQVEKLEKEIEGLHTRKDQETARAMRAIMGLREPVTKHHHDAQLREHREFLASQFARQAGHLTSITLHDLRQSREFADWAQKDSSMLILHGCNHEGTQAVTQSWLSPAALDFVADLHSSEPRAIPAHCLCSLDMTPDEAMKSLTAQLLDTQSQLLRCKSIVDNIEVDLGKQQDGVREGGRGHAATSLAGYCRAITRIANECQDPIYLVVDRPEKCHATPAQTWVFLKSLLGLVTGSTKGLKILVVIRTEHWNIQERMDDIGQDLVDSRRIVIMRRDQMRML